VRTRTIIRIVTGAIAALLATTAPAMAQGPAPAARGFIGAFGGITSGTAETGSVFGARAGVEIGGGVHIIGEFGRMNDVLPSELRDELDLAESFLELELGMPVTIDMTVPATYGFVGARWSHRAGRVSPFVEGGVGVAKLTLKLNEVSVGGVDLSSFVRDELDTSDLETSEPLLIVGGGVNAELTAVVSADLGYRYSRILTEDPAVNTNTFYGMIIVGWK
jgi:opacity protein-like surface antigen